VILMNYQMKLGAHDTNPNKPESVHVFNVLRLMFPVMAYFMANLPVGIMVSIITGIGMTALTSVVLQRAVIRRMMGIPPLPAHPPTLPTFRESRAALYKALEEQQRAAEAEMKKRKI